MLTITRPPPARRHRRRRRCSAGAAWAQDKGLITIIVNDPANPYWFTEGEVAKATAEEMGYTATVGRPHRRHQHRDRT